jgi:LCP family protein required for cell wall assembly
MSDSYAASGRASVPGPARPDRPYARATVRASQEPAHTYGTPRGDGPPGDGPPPALVGKPRRPGWSRRRKVLIITLVALLVLVGVGGGGLYFYVRGLENNMERIEVFSQITGERPAKPVDGVHNILLLGSDSRDPDAVEGDPYRADTIMLLHIPSSNDEAYLISIPRDLWVYIPTSPDGTAGDTEAKINAATVFGGVPLSVMTVENYTGVRVDNVMLIDFGGFVEVTDALGGIDMNIKQTITSIHKPNRTFEEGTQHLNGEEALDYIRQRYQFADGDFTRMRNQQQFLRRLMDKAADSGTLRNPAKLNAFLQTATSTLTVDEELSLFTVGWKLRKIRGDNLTFVTSPNTGTGQAGGQSVVLSDDAGKDALYEAVRHDRVAQWAAENLDRD